MSASIRLKHLGFLIWLNAVIFYLYQYILRVSPGSMMDDVMGHFNINAHWFGILCSAATFCYASLQLPAGILSDLFGARRMILISISACVLGTMTFATTDHFWIAYLGRVFIGAGSACAFLCVSKIASDWFPADKKALMFALTATMGTIGAMFGGKPLVFLSNAYGWQQTLLFLSAVGIAILILNFFSLSNKKAPYGGEISNRSETMAGIKEVFKSRFCWMYAIVALGIYLAISVFADLWGTSFLVLKYGLAREDAAFANSLIYFGTCIGVVIVALLSRLFKDPRPIIIATALIVPTLFAWVVFSDNLSYAGICAILFMIGFVSGGEVLCFSIACAQMSIKVAGTVTGFINFIVCLGAAILQQQVGQVLNKLWDGTIGDNGLPLYTVANYQGAMMIVIIASLSSFVLSFFLVKENRKLATA